MHLLVGYGSLINPQSRLRSLSKNSKAMPITLTNFKRLWAYPCQRKNYTALAVKRSKGSNINAVIFQIDPKDLPKLDEREKNYARVRIDPCELNLLPQNYQNSTPETFTVKSLHSATIWIYCMPNEIDQNHSYSRWNDFGSINNNYSRYLNDNHLPCESFPIPQSYIDCVLSGCLRFGIEFAREFLKTTDCWSGSWINDRNACIQHRKYICRADIGESICLEAIKTVDVLLNEFIPFQKSFTRTILPCCEYLERFS